MVEARMCLEGEGIVLGLPLDGIPDGTLIAKHKALADMTRHSFLMKVKDIGFMCKLQPDQRLLIPGH